MHDALQGGEAIAITLRGAQPSSGRLRRRSAWGNATLVRGFCRGAKAKPRGARSCHIGQIRSMSSVHPVLSRRRLRAIAGLDSSAAVSWRNRGPSNAAVS
jgi:hypothetical protein